MCAMQLGWDPIDELDNDNDEPVWSVWLLVALVIFVIVVKYLLQPS